MTKEPPKRSFTTTQHHNHVSSATITAPPKMTFRSFSLSSLGSHVVTITLLLTTHLSYHAVIASPLHHHHHHRQLTPRSQGYAAFGRRRIPKTSCITTIPRGGSITTTPANTEEHAPPLDQEDIELLQQQKQQQQEELNQLLKYQREQHHLLQLRSTFLSEVLAKRGVPVGPTLLDVCTADGDRPPQAVDWDCCWSTLDDPKTCLYSFDAEPNTKVLAPIGTTQYISLSALNRLRRTDPTKVEPMWHSQYSILSSWFSDESEFSLLQFVGWKGFLVSSVMLEGTVLKALLALGLLGVLLVVMPILEFVVGRVLVSAGVWRRWSSWGRIVHAALPLKLLIGQMTWKFVAGSFAKLEAKVREYVVDLECAILEDCIPITVGDGSEEVDEENDQEEEVDDDEEEEEEEDGEEEEDYNDEQDDDDYDEEDW